MRSRAAARARAPSLRPRLAACAVVLASCASRSRRVATLEVALIFCVHSRATKLRFARNPSSSRLSPRICDVRPPISPASTISMCAYEATELRISRSSLSKTSKGSPNGTGSWTSCSKSSCAHESTRAPRFHAGSTSTRPFAGSLRLFLMRLLARGGFGNAMSRPLIRSKSQVRSSAAICEASFFSDQLSSRLSTDEMGRREAPSTRPQFL
mmetsp:Transcript_19077/g.50196  ORF Transcript_19077/g.50196 Transcript_19077/m.50196 type:complete len:211 (-) Transcript_19077:828-1460(-)